MSQPRQPPGDRGDDESSGLLTLLLTDVVGSTATAAKHGDDFAQEVLRAHNDLVTTQVSTHAGSIERRTGDGLMASFPSPTRALTCAIAIQRAIAGHNVRDPAHQLQVRIGVHAGEVYGRGGDLSGATVDFVGKVTAKAGGGQILVGEVVKQLVGTASGIEFLDRGRARLQGANERWRVYEVGWLRPAMGGTAGAPARTPLVGRDREMAELVDRMERATSGAGAFVVIGGEPGIGKTRITQELIAEAHARGVRILVGRCQELEQAPPYAPFIEMLDSVIANLTSAEIRGVLGPQIAEIARIMPVLNRMFPDVPAPMALPADQARQYVVRALTEVMNRIGSFGAMLLVYEDLHWADEGTLMLLRNLAERASSLPVLTVGTYRDAELELSPSLTRTLYDIFNRKLAVQMTLGRLSQSEVGAMLNSLSGRDAPEAVVAAVYGGTDGNPFFVEEVVEYLSDENRLFDAAGSFRTDLKVVDVGVPDTVRLMVRRRVGRLAANTQRMLGAAAIIGRDFGSEVLSMALETGDDTLAESLEEAQRSRIIQPRVGYEGQYTFAHALIHQAVLSELSLPRAQRYHLRVADAIESLHANGLDDYAADLGSHLFQAGATSDSRRTARYLSMAGQAALRATAFEEAARSFQRALSLNVNEDVLVAEIQEGLGMAQRSMGRWDDALASWDQAIDLYERAGEADRMGGMCAEAAQQLAWANRWMEGMSLVGRGLAALGDRPSPDRSRLLGMQALAFSLAGQHEVAAGMMRESQALAEALDDDSLLGRALYIEQVDHMLYLRYDTCLQVGNRAIDHLRRGGDLFQLATSLTFQRLCLQSQGRWTEGDEVGEECRRVSERVGNLGAIQTNERMDMMRAVGATGDLAAFRKAAARDLEAAQGFSAATTADAHAFMAICEFWRGDVESAISHADSSAEHETPGAYGGGGAFAALFRALTGRQAEADEIRARRSLGSDTAARNMTEWCNLLVAVEVLFEEGRNEDAAALYGATATAAAAGAATRPWDARSTHSLAEMAAAAGGQWELAESHFAAARAWLGDGAMRRFEVPRVLMSHAEVLSRRGRPGDRESAQDFFTRAAERAERL